jgi:hypothetical protein
MNIYDMEIVRIDTKTIPLKFYTESGVVDITDWTVFFTMKVKITDPDSSALIQKTITVHTDALNGETEIELTTTDTTQNPGNYVYDIQVKYSGEIKTILTGTITILSGVTIRVA